MEGVGFYMGTRLEAYNAELFAIIWGLHYLAPCRGRAEHYTVFIDSQDAMRRVRSDAPGTGHGSGDHRSGPGHLRPGQHRYCSMGAGTQGNELADQYARAAAESGVSDRESRQAAKRTSLPSLRRRATERATSRWRENIKEKNQGKRTFRLPRRYYRGPCYDRLCRSAVKEKRPCKKPPPLLRQQRSRFHGPSGRMWRDTK